MNLANVLIGIGLLQAIILGSVLVLFPKAGNRVSYLMAAVMGLCALLMLSEFLEPFRNTQWLRELLEFSIFIDLLFAPLILWLARFGLGLKEQLQWKDLYHLVPLLGGVLILMFNINDGKASFSHIPDAIAVLIGWKFLVLVVYASIVLRDFRDNWSTSNDPSELSLVGLLKKVIIGFVLIALVSYTLFCLVYAGYQLAYDSDTIAVFLLTGFIYFLSFNLLRQPQLLIELKALPKPPKYKSSSLDESSRQDYLEALQALLESRKPYLDEKLTLDSLATELQISSNALSQVINEGLGLSFYDLVNDYRLQQVKAKLTDPAEAHKTILSLAYESGFQSKATFNRIFKKAEGMTPMEYRKKVRSQLTH